MDRFKIFLLMLYINLSIKFLGDWIETAKSFNSCIFSFLLQIHEITKNIPLKDLKEH